MGIIPQRYDKPRFDFAQIQAPLKTYFYNVTAAVGSTSSGTFVDAPGPREKLITKRETATALFVSGSLGAFKGTNAGNIYFALLINGVDYLIAQFFFNDLGTHRAFGFTSPIANGLVAGNYTARLRWRTDNVNANMDANDVIHIRFDEGYFG